MCTEDLDSTASMIQPADHVDPTAHLALEHDQLTSERGIVRLKQQPQEQRDHRDSFTRSNGRGFGTHRPNPVASRRIVALGLDENLGLMDSGPEAS
jgi:hypothetical protein